MNPENYAHALWATIERGEKPKTAIENLKALLDREGRSAIFNRVLKLLQRIVERESMRQRVVLTVAKESDARMAEKEAAEHLEQIGVKKSEITVAVDENVIGGWVLEGRERLVDASFKKQLLSLYNRATK